MQCSDCKTCVSADTKPGDEKLYVKKLRKCMNEGLYFPSGATKLFDFLYLGGQDEATNLHLLTELGITHIINCASGYRLLILYYFLLKYIYRPTHIYSVRNMLRYICSVVILKYL